MKFYSEKLEKFFDSEKECVEAEELIAQQEKEKKDIAESKQNERKQYAKVIEEADKVLDAEYTHYNEVKKQIVSLRKQCDEQCEKLLLDAKKQLKEAQDKKFAAVQKFNEKFGPYKVSYTGEAAMKEMKRHLDSNGDIFNWFFPFFNF